MTEDAIACPLSTPLHLAVEADRNRQKVVELLLAHGADVTLRNGFSMTPLHCALYSDPFQEKYWGKNSEKDNSLKIVYEAVTSKESNLMDPFGLTYFHAAIALNDLTMVKNFIKNGQADYKPILPNSRNFTMYTPLHFAVKYGHEDIAKLFIEQGADVNANEDENHFDTPLQVAVKFGQWKMIDFLLAHGANVKISTYEENQTLLHLLVERFNEYDNNKSELLRTVDTFIRHGVDVNALNSYKITPLHKACWKMDKGSELIFKLLNEGADINALNMHDEVAFSGIYWDDNVRQFEVLLKLYYHVKKVKELGLIVHPQNDEFCEKVLKHKEEWQQDDDEWPVIEKICATEESINKRQDWIQEIEKLKEDMLNEKVSLYDYLRMEANEAIKFSENRRIKELIADELFRSVYPVYGYLIPVAHRHCHRSLEPPQQPTQKAQTKAHTSPLKFINGKLYRPGDFVPPVFRQKKLINSIRSTSENNDETLPTDISLHDAIKLGNTIWVKELLAKGASTKFIDIKKNGPLHLAFTLNHEEIVDLLLSYIQEKSEYINFPNHQGITQLHIAASRGNTFVVQKLLDAGADPKDFVHENSSMYPNYTALRFACDFKHLETVKILAKAMELFGNITDDDEGSVAAISHKSSYSNMAVFLSRLLEDGQHLSEFHEACFSCQKTVAHLMQLLDRGVDMNAPMDRNSKNYPLYTALHFAVESDTDRQEKVELLLQHGADVNLKNGFGMTPLHLAAYNDFERDKSASLDGKEEKDDTLQILYDTVINKEENPMDAFGLTYFHIAVAMNDLRFVKKMLFEGENVNRIALPNVFDFANYSPLHFATRYGHSDMVKLLIERGAKVDDGNDNPRYSTPLQLAIIHGNSKVVHILLDHGANARVVQPSTKKTTLHLLIDCCREMTGTTAEERDEKFELGLLVEKLVKGGADIDAKDSDGLTALHVACMSLSTCCQMISWLLFAGADINIKAGCKTALDFANGSWFRRNYDDFFMLYEHVQKLKELELKVDQRNEEFCKFLKIRKHWEENEDVYWNLHSDEKLEKKKQERQKEIQKLKKDMLTDKVSMYDYIRMNEKEAAAYLGIERLRKIDGIVVAEKLYRNFGYLIPVVYRKSKKWLEDQGKPKTTTAVKQLTGPAQVTKRKRE